MEATACIGDPMCRLHPTKPLAAIKAGQFCNVDRAEVKIYAERKAGELSGSKPGPSSPIKTLNDLGQKIKDYRVPDHLRRGAVLYPTSSTSITQSVEGSGMTAPGKEASRKLVSAVSLNKLVYDVLNEFPAAPMWNVICANTSL